MGELVRLSPHVVAWEEGRRGLGWSNSGFVTAGGGMVVDTLYDVALTRRMADAYASVHPSPPARVVNTHHNGDHCWGNQVYAGAEIVAHAGCARRFADVSPERMQQIKTMPDAPEQLQDLQHELAGFDFSDVVLTPPTRVIEGDTTIDLDGVQVDLLHVGPAHTEGDVIASVPDEGVVIAGDVFFHRCAPIGWEGSTDQWIGALQRIESLAPQHVVPGHGPLCGVDAVRDARQYLEHVRDEARSGWKNGQPVLDTCLKLDLGRWAEWDEPERVAATVHRVYRECDGWTWDQPYDMGQVMDDVRHLKRTLG